MLHERFPNAELHSFVSVYVGKLVYNLHEPGSAVITEVAGRCLKSRAYFVESSRGITK